MKLVLTTLMAYKALHGNVWVTRALWILIPIFVLKFRTESYRNLIVIMVLWNVIDLLNSAIGEPEKNNDLVYKYADTESDPSGMDTGVGPASGEVSLEREPAQEDEPDVETSDVGSCATPEGL
jgi:hypothetical protein